MPSCALPDCSGFIDAHLHLQDPALDSIRAEFLATAPDQQITSLWVNATHPGDWPDVRRLAEQSSTVFPFYGVHPWYVASVRNPRWAEELEMLLVQHPRSAVGEIGLDRWRKPCEEALQEAYFVRQLELARIYHRPVCIHCLKAWDWLEGVFNRAGRPESGFLLHSFFGSSEILRRMIRHGAYFSFSSSALRPDRPRLQELLRQTPPERIFIETDAPDMPALSCAGGITVRTEAGEERNSPRNLPLFYRLAAQILGWECARLREQISANACRFLAPLGMTARDLPPPPQPD